MDNLFGGIFYGRKVNDLGVMIHYLFMVNNRKQRKKQSLCEVKDVLGQYMGIKGRLKAIANMVPPSDSLADIGTDHGYIPTYLVTKGTIERAIAADISRPSLARAQALIKAEGLEDRIQTRLGDGLAILSIGEVDTIILAGVGGGLTSEILSRDREIAQATTTLVLQPMTAIEDLRRWLAANGYRIFDEDLVKERGRIYEIIAVTPGYREMANDLYHNIGEFLINKKHPLLKEYIFGKIRIAKGIISELDGNRTNRSILRLNEYKEKLDQYKEVYDGL